MSDLIDREAVREFIKSYRHSTDVAFDMEDHLDEITTVSQWHKVEEPPKVGVPVLVTYIGYNTGETLCDLLAAYDGTTWRYWDDGMCEEVNVRITHWMPIEPPKEDA